MYGYLQLAGSVSRQVWPLLTQGINRPSDFDLWPFDL